MSQTNPALATGVALGCNTQVSSLTATAFTALLQDGAMLNNLIALNKKRLANAYIIISNFLRARKIQYVASTAGVYVWVKLSDRVETWEQEAKLQDCIMAEHVVVSAGRSYASPKPGWFRVSFAIGDNELYEGLKRLSAGINEYNKTMEAEIEALQFPKTTALNQMTPVAVKS